MRRPGSEASSPAGAALLAVALGACSGTFGAPPPEPDDSALDAVIPADFDELPRLELDWQSDSADEGVLRGLLESGEVVAGRILLRDLEQDTRELDTGATDRGFEQGADLFSPFPERWPAKTNNVLNPSRPSRVEVTIGTEKGRVLECKLLLEDAALGFLGGARGTCRDEEGQRYRTYVRP